MSALESEALFDLPAPPAPDVINTPTAFGAVRGSRRVALISCSAQKLDHAAPAARLYTSTLFRKAVAYAVTHCDGWHVLSGKHGLVAPEQVIEPYDQKLTVTPTTVDGRKIPTEWAGDVSRALATEYGVVELWSTTFVVLAGGIYEENLRTIAGTIDMEFPLAGMQIGERLQWLTRQVRPIEDVDLPSTPPGTEEDHSHPKSGRAVGPLTCVPCIAGNHSGCMGVACRCDHPSPPAITGGES